MGAAGFALSAAQAQQAAPTPTVLTPTVNVPTPTVNDPTVRVPSPTVRVPEVRTPTVEPPTTPTVRAPEVQTPTITTTTPQTRSPTVNAPTPGRVGGIRPDVRSQGRTQDLDRDDVLKILRKPGQ